MYSHKDLDTIELRQSTVGCRTDSNSNNNSPTSKSKEKYNKDKENTYREILKNGYNTPLKSSLRNIFEEINDEKKDGSSSTLKKENDNNNVIFNNNNNSSDNFLISNENNNDNLTFRSMSRRRSSLKLNDPKLLSGIAPTSNNLNNGIMSHNNSNNNSNHNSIHNSNNNSNTNSNTNSNYDRNNNISGNHIKRFSNENSRNNSTDNSRNNSLRKMLIKHGSSNDGSNTDITTFNTTNDTDHRDGSCSRNHSNDSKKDFNVLFGSINNSNDDDDDHVHPYNENFDSNNNHNNNMNNHSNNNSDNYNNNNSNNNINNSNYHINNIKNYSSSSKNSSSNSSNNNSHKLSSKNSFINNTKFVQTIRPNSVSPSKIVSPEQILENEFNKKSSKQNSPIRQVVVSQINSDSKYPKILNYKDCIENYKCLDEINNDIYNNKNINNYDINPNLTINNTNNNQNINNIIIRNNSDADFHLLSQVEQLKTEKKALRKALRISRRKESKDVSDYINEKEMEENSTYDTIYSKRPSFVLPEISVAAENRKNSFFNTANSTGKFGSQKTPAVSKSLDSSFDYSDRRNNYSISNNYYNSKSTNNIKLTNNYRNNSYTVVNESSHSRSSDNLYQMNNIESYHDNEGSFYQMRRNSLSNPSTRPIADGIIPKKRNSVKFDIFDTVDVDVDIDANIANVIKTKSKPQKKVKSEPPTSCPPLARIARTEVITSRGEISSARTDESTVRIDESIERTRFYDNEIEYDSSDHAGSDDCNFEFENLERVANDKWLDDRHNNILKKGEIPPEKTKFQRRKSEGAIKYVSSNNSNRVEEIHFEESSFAPVKPRRFSSTQYFDYRKQQNGEL